jgi:hypothetical protein
MSRPGMKLTQQAEDDRADYHRTYGYNGGCTCFLSPPCGSCVHPGNPRNQEEDDECWEELTNQEIEKAKKEA